MKRSAFSLIELSIVILIIGILIAGVTQGSRLVSEMRLATARNMTQNSPVASIPGVVLWLEPTLEKSFDIAEQEDGLTITNWYDINPQSTYKINLTQSTSARRPNYRSNSVNN